MNKDSHLDGLTKITAQNHDSTSEITNHYNHGQCLVVLTVRRAHLISSLLVLHGYSATLTGASLEHVLTSSDVEYVEENGRVDIGLHRLEILKYLQ